jgi:gluconolactonase
MMKLPFIKVALISIVFLMIFCPAFAQQIKPEAKMIINDPGFYKVIPENTQIEIIGEGFEWTEGPLWLDDQKKLIFSDIPKNSVFEWTEENGIKLYLKPSGYTGLIQRSGEPGSNGLLLSPEGKLVLCQHGDRRMATMNAPVAQPKPEFITLAAKYNGKMLNSPNDAVYHKNGDLYFTDPPYGLEKNVNDPGKELDFQGIYKIDKAGKMTLLSKELSRPNGIAFSPDYTKLYVANSDPGKAIWMVYDLKADGITANGRVLFDATSLTKTSKGLPDGMKVHQDGWIFATGPGGVLIINPEGKHLGTIFTGEATANCAFNNDYSVLYVTADNYLLRVKLK